MAWTLCTKQDIEGLHPIPIVSLRDDWSELVEALIREHMDSPFLGITDTITNEYHDGDGTPILRVKNPPIYAVTEVKINDVLLSAGDYVVFNTYVQLKSQVFPQGNLNVMVSYIAGSVTVPYTVRLAAISMIVAIANYRNRSGADTSLKWSAGDQKVGEESANLQVGLASHLRAIMKQILRRPVVRFK